MVCKGVTMFHSPTSYIGTHWIKFYPNQGIWEEDHRFTNTERFKLLLPEFKSLITRALETKDPKAYIQAHQNRLDEIKDQYKIDSEIVIK